MPPTARARRSRGGSSSSAATSTTRPPTSRAAPRKASRPVAAPDNLTFDANGNVWIATDGQQGTLDRADAFHAVPVEGPERGRVRQFLSVPAGAEACGPELAPDQRTMFCAVQHPGERYASSRADGSGNPPRPSVISMYTTHGDKRIGS